jgi:hypothetical protein
MFLLALSPTILGQEATFQNDVSLVQVEVDVRERSSPVVNLKKDESGPLTKARAHKNTSIRSRTGYAVPSPQRAGAK